MTKPTRPTRSQGDLAEMVEMLLDKGVVVNADITVHVGDTELLGVQIRAAIASFETAAEYGLEFPSGTDMERVREAADVPPADERTDEPTAVSETEEVIDAEGGPVEERDGEAGEADDAERTAEGAETDATETDEPMDQS